jgi:hypothetical protein
MPFSGGAALSQSSDSRLTPHHQAASPVTLADGTRASRHMIRRRRLWTSSRRNRRAPTALRCGTMTGIT